MEVARLRAEEETIHRLTVVEVVAPEVEGVEDSMFAQTRADMKLD